MSEKNPQAKTAAGQSSANPPSPPQQAGAKPARKGASSALVLLPLVLIVAGTVVWYSMNQKTSPPVASASLEAEEDFDVESEPVEDTSEEAATEPETEEAAEPATEAATTPAAPTTGTLDIRSDVAGADVFLNGERVGKTPYKASGLAFGKYSVKVQKEGYASFEKRVDLGPKQQVVRAKLAAATATLRVEANVPGAKVSLDGEDRGTTPVELPNVKPGRHELVVSAAGYETRTETIEVESGKRDIKVDLVSPSPVATTLNEAVAVKHKHRIGSCDGVLRVSTDRLEYDSTDKHAFSVALADVERFTLDKETLNLKVRDGKTYNFNERNDNHPALASFHERIAPSVTTRN